MSGTTNNIDVKDAASVTQTVSTTLAAGVHTPRHIVDSLPLPPGAATSAKQPALGTAGTASADVITVQGIAAGTAVPVSLTALSPGTGAANLGKAQGGLSTAVAAAAGDTGVLSLAVVRAVPSSVVEGNYDALQMSQGRLHVGSVNRNVEDLLLILINDIRALQRMFLNAVGDDTDQDTYRDMQDTV